MRRRPKRAGYAMVMVLIFIAILLSVYSVSHRHMAAALRVEKAREAARQRDEGSVQALARGLDLLETGSPPSARYICDVMIDTSRGPRSMTVTFRRRGKDKWIVEARPTVPPESHPPMPDTFAP